MELYYKWARVKFLHWPVKMSSNTGNIFLSTCRTTLLHCKLKSVVALISTFAPNLSRNKFQCCKLRQHVAQSRPEFYFLQQTFNLMFCATTCYASQHLWLVNFPAPKARERWWVSARLTSCKFWARTNYKWPVRTSAICGLWKFYRSSAFLANYMRKIMWLLISIHTVIAVQ